MLRSDLEYLYDLADREGDAWRFGGIAVDPDRFLEQLGHDALQQLLVIDNHSGRPIGLASAFAHDRRNSTAHVAIIVEPECKAAAATSEALFLLVRYLFEAFNLRKVYAEVVDSNYRCFSSGEDVLFDHEAVIRQGQFLSGSYHDLHVLGISKQLWDRVGGPLSRLFRV